MATVKADGKKPIVEEDSTELVGKANCLHSSLSISIAKVPKQQNHQSGKHLVDKSCMIVVSSRPADSGLTGR